MIPEWLFRFPRVLACGIALSGIGCHGTAVPQGASAGISRVDLTTRPWFPPIVRQQGNSCAQQVGLYYLLSAERNRERSISAGSPTSRLSPYQAYAVLADSMISGTHLTDGWNLARETGVPLESDLPRGGRGLMHGFDKYVRALRQRPLAWKLLPLRTVSDLRAVKDQLAAGHPVACDFQVRGLKLLKRPEGGALVRQWGRNGPGHTMVIAGYDDTIGYDANGDGRISNDLDISGDGRVTLADHERGAFLIVNPWGPRWGDGGKAWAPFREHALSPWPRAGEVAVVQAAGSEPPRLVLRLSLALKERGGLLISASDGSHTIDPLPFRRNALPYSSGGSPGSWEVFGKMHRPGPQISSGPLTNPAGGPLEMGLDVSPLSGGRSFKLTLATAGPPLQGTLHAASFVQLDAVGRTLRETPVQGLPLVLPPGGGTWTAPQ
jgi:hypothetical protein